MMPRERAEGPALRVEHGGGAAAEPARELPFSLEAEQAVLCAIVQYGAGDQAALLLDAAAFYREGHRRLFRAMGAVHGRGEAIDPITLRAELDRRGELETVGGVEYLTYLLDVVPSAANFDHHVAIIQEHARRRRLIEAGSVMVEEASAGRTPTVDLVAQSRERLDEVAAAGRMPAAPDAAEAFLSTIGWRNLAALPEAEIFKLLEVFATGLQTAVRSVAAREHARLIVERDLDARGIPGGWRVVDRTLEAAARRIPVPAFPRYTVETLGQVQDQGDLIAGWLPAGSLAVLYSPPGAGKTFLALSMALAIASARSWQGRDVEHGLVVYWSGEGTRRRLDARIHAWREYHNALGEAPILDVLTDPFSLLDPDHVQAFVGAMRDGLSLPRLVVLDTLSRALAGADENRADVIGGAVATLDRIREALGCAVLLLHHTPHSAPERERGHSSLRGAADVMWGLREDGDRRILTGTKMRDGDQGQPMQLRLEPVADSCVLVPAAATTGEEVTATDRTLLRVLVDATAADEPLAMGAWRKMAASVTSASEPTFYRVRKHLLTLGLIVSHGKRGAVVVTPAGRERAAG